MKPDSSALVSYLRASLGKISQLGGPQAVLARAALEEAGRIARQEERDCVRR